MALRRLFDSGQLSSQSCGRPVRLRHASPRNALPRREQDTRTAFSYRPWQEPCGSLLCSPRPCRRDCHQFVTQISRTRSCCARRKWFINVLCMRQRSLPGQVQPSQTDYAVHTQRSCACDQRQRAMSVQDVFSQAVQASGDVKNGAHMASTVVRPSGQPPLGGEQRAPTRRERARPSPVEPC
jgi:hypothetical protein